jgi:hypothetical protein
MRIPYFVEQGISAVNFTVIAVIAGGGKDLVEALDAGLSISFITFDLQKRTIAIMLYHIILFKLYIYIHC